VTAAVMRAVRYSSNLAPRTLHFELPQAELVGGTTKAFFRSVSGHVLLRWRDPVHEIQLSSSLVALRTMVFQMLSKASQKGQST
jgi:hypothetical protein